jgi:divalent metal cation (Fe/Co/Zn/Cd) transporter
MKMEIRFLLSGIVLVATAAVLGILVLLYIMEGAPRIPRQETIWISTALFVAVLSAMFFLRSYYDRTRSIINSLAEGLRAQLARRAMATYIVTVAALSAAVFFAVIADYAFRLQLLEYPVFHYTLVALVGFSIALFIVYDGLREGDGETP